MIALYCYSLDSIYAQEVVVKTVTVTQTIDNQFVGLKPVNFTVSDFISSNTVIDRVEVTINWTKTDNTCEVPQGGDAYHDEISFSLTSPTGVEVVLASVDTWGGNDDIDYVVTTFSNDASSQPSGIPVSGIFLPKEGLALFSGQDALGKWFLSAGDSADQDPLCIESYTVKIVTTALDSDNDGKNDLSDKDDDNDGILDVDEKNCQTVTIPSGVPIVFASKGVDEATSINPAVGSYWLIDDTDDELVLDLGAVAPAGTKITLEGYGLRDDALVAESLDNVNYSGDIVVDFGGWSSWVTRDYILQSDTRFLRIKKANIGAIVKLYLSKNYSYESFQILKCVDIDTDVDGVPNHLDVDSDNDGCPDAVEGEANIDQIQLDTSSEILGGVDVDGIPQVVGGSGQGVGSSTKASQINVTLQPKSHQVCVGNPVSFTTSAEVVIATQYGLGVPDFINNTISENVNYKWQYSTDNGSTWLEVFGQSGVVVSGGVIKLDLGTQNDVNNTANQYRVEFTSESMSCPIYSEAVSLTVNKLPNNIVSSGFDGGNICKGAQGTLVFNAEDDSLFPYTIEYRDENSARTYTQTISSQSAESFNVVENLTLEGVYNYTLLSITNKNGCKRTAGLNDVTAKITVRENPAQVLQVTVNDYDVCVGDTSPIITFTNSDTKNIIITYNLNGGNVETLEVGAGTFVEVSVPTSLTGVFTYNIVSVKYKSSPNCEAVVGKKLCVVVFPKNNVAPTVNTGVKIPIVVTSPPIISGFDIEYSFDDGLTWGANTPPTGNNCQGYKIKTRYKSTGSCASATTTLGCATSPSTIRVVDVISPTFRVPNNFVFCVENIVEASYYNPTVDIAQTRPEYYLFRKGSTVLDLDEDSFVDNCCQKSDMTLSWTINFEGGVPSPINGVGQPSTYAENIELLGDGVNFVDKNHSITYVLTDCNANKTQKTVKITVRPRPRITKKNH